MCQNIYKLTYCNLFIKISKSLYSNKLFDPIVHK